jgi:hypothetical protein
MTSLDIISLEAAKRHLVILNDNFYDAQIEGIIGTAIAMIEQYTGHYFYPRAKSYPVTSSVTYLTDYPIDLTGIIDNSGQPVSSFNVGISQGSLSTIVNYWCYYDCGNGNPTINATIGYASTSDIPQPLIGAAYKLITYLFENKDAYAATIPYDVQVMINQYRRSSSI